VSCLVILSGRAKGHTYQISPDRENLVGRTGDCDACIVDPRMSRRHCVISAGRTGYTIRDLDSANGVWLNGRKVREAGLQEGDRIRLGFTEMEFHVTERFEDAETKRLVPAETKPPDLGLEALAGKPAKKTPAVLFCSRCSGSIPAADLDSGRAAQKDGRPVCAECLARQQARIDSARKTAELVGKDVAAAAAESAAAEEVSRLAAELAAGEPGDKPSAAEAARPPKAKLVARKPPKAKPVLAGARGSEEAVDLEPPEEEDAVPVGVAEGDDQFNTDALLIGEGTFDDAPAPEAPAGSSAEPAAPTEPAEPTELAEPAEAAKPAESGEAAEPEAPGAEAGEAEGKSVDRSAKTIRYQPGEIPLTVEELADEITRAVNRGDDEAPFPGEPLTSEEIVELHEDDLPRLPDEKPADGYDEDARTPRPGSGRRVL
jgi:pSer/pThr/pTyr-binding forkhead associated (FHA) protein